MIKHSSIQRFFSMLKTIFFNIIIRISPTILPKRNYQKMQQCSSIIAIMSKTPLSAKLTEIKSSIQRKFLELLFRRIDSLSYHNFMISKTRKNLKYVKSCFYFVRSYVSKYLMLIRSKSSFDKLIIYKYQFVNVA